MAATNNTEYLARHLLSVLHDHSLSKTGQISPWKLLTFQDETLKEFHDSFEYLKKEEWISVDGQGKITVTEKGKTALPQQATKQTKPFSLKCATCEGKGYCCNAYTQTTLERFKDIMKSMPPSKEEYDQQTIAPEDTLIRVGFIHERGDLLDKELLMIGDDDLLSIACSLTGLPKRVVVLEVDVDLVAFINKVAAEHNLPLKAHIFDVRFPLPKEFQKSFDVFCCDPVETLEGIKLFLSRGVEALKGVKSCSYFGLTALEASKRKWYDIQKLLFEMNFVITDMRRNFNGYPDNGLEEKHIIFEKLGSAPDCVWYWSALYRVEAVMEPKPLVQGEYELSDDIYADDEAWATPQLN